MSSQIQYIYFEQMTPPEKADFLDDFILKDYHKAYSVPELKVFLNSIVINTKNAFLQQKALEIYSSLVQQRILMGSAFVGVLVEDINDLADPFVLICRLKLLYLHFDASKESEDVFDHLSNHLNADVASEALYRRGLLCFNTIPLKANSSYLKAILESKQYFDRSSAIVENRVDANYFGSVCALLSALMANARENYSALGVVCNEKLWQLQLFSQVKDFKLEYQISNALGLAIEMAEKISTESEWTDYRLSFGQIFELHQRLLNLEVEELVDPIVLENLRAQLSTQIIAPLYRLNFTVCSAKIRIIIDREDNNDFRSFLEDIQASLQQVNIKKKDNGNLLATLARKYINIPTNQIENDLAAISDNDPLALAALIGQYADQDSRFCLTGYPQGDEIFEILDMEIRNFLPDYPEIKLRSFSVALSNVIAYVVRSMQDKKEFFPELYDSTLVKGKTEHVFQESLYRNLRQSTSGHRYLYEPNQSGGGRIDITYNEGTVVYPIEVKKTPSVPTWTSIVKDYVAQAQTYVNAYDQLGIFVVFDLSKKTTSNSPLNDVRELFSFQSLQVHYPLGGNYPNGVVCVIVPANKVSPSSMSTYR